MKGLEFAIGFVSMLMIILFYLILARKYGVVDHPNKRTMHKGAIVRGAGIIFPVTYLIWLLLNDFQNPYLFCGITLLSITCLIDDFNDLSTGVRLLLQFLSMILLFLELEAFSVYPWYFSVLALTVAVGTINTFNFMDGINGITAGYNFVLFAILAWINIYLVSFTDQEVIVYILLSLVAFAIFNFRRDAKCFAGDIGSVLLGYILVYQILTLVFVSNNLIWIFIPLVYGLDSVITIMQRLRNGENIFSAHRSHLFQLLVSQYKYSHVSVALSYMVVQAIYSTLLVVIFIYQEENWLPWVIVLTITGSLTYLFTKSKITGSVWLPKDN